MDEPKTFHTPVVEDKNLQSPTLNVEQHTNLPPKQKSNTMLIILVVIGIILLVAGVLAWQFINVIKPAEFTREDIETPSPTIIARDESPIPTLEKPTNALTPIPTKMVKTLTTPLIASSTWVTKNLPEIKKTISIPSDWSFKAIKTESTKYDYDKKDDLPCTNVNYEISDPSENVTYNIDARLCNADGGCGPFPKNQSKVLKEISKDKIFYRTYTVYENNVSYNYNLGKSFAIISEKEGDMLELEDGLEISSGPSKDLLQDSTGRIVWPSCQPGPFINASTKNLIPESDLERTLDKISASYYKL